MKNKESMHKKDIKNNSYETYAIENGHKNQTKSKKQIKTHKDLHKYTIPRNNRFKSRFSKSAQTPTNKVADPTTRSMLRMKQLQEPNFVPVLV